MRWWLVQGPGRFLDARVVVRGSGDDHAKRSAFRLLMEHAWFAEQFTDEGAWCDASAAWPIERPGRIAFDGNP